MGEPCACFPRRLYLAALATLGGTSRAEGVLDLMEQQFLPRPSLYENVITSWCAETGMAAHARQLLTRMEGMLVAYGYESIRPNRSSYNMVIQASEDRLETEAAAAE